MRHFLSAAAMVCCGTSLTQQALAADQVKLRYATEVVCDATPLDSMRRHHHLKVIIVDTDGQLFSANGRGIAYVTVTNGMDENEKFIEVRSSLSKRYSHQIYSTSGTVSKVKNPDGSIFTTLDYDFTLVQEGVDDEIRMTYMGFKGPYSAVCSVIK